MNSVLHIVAWVIVTALFAFAVSWLWLAWRLWRLERREQSETGWRLRRSVRIFRRASASQSKARPQSSDPGLRREPAVQPPAQSAHCR
jgi:hypothetical protein